MAPQILLVLLPKDQNNIPNFKIIFYISVYCSLQWNWWAFWNQAVHLKNWCGKITSFTVFHITGRLLIQQAPWGNIYEQTLSAFCGAHSHEHMLIFCTGWMKKNTDSCIHTSNLNPGIFPCSAMVFPLRCSCWSNSSFPAGLFNKRWSNDRLLYNREDWILCTPSFTSQQHLCQDLHWNWNWNSIYDNIRWISNIFLHCYKYFCVILMGWESPK